MSATFATMSNWPEWAAILKIVMSMSSYVKDLKLCWNESHF